MEKNSKSPAAKPTLVELAAFVYGSDRAEQIAGRLQDVGGVSKKDQPLSQLPLNHGDAVLISYGDSLLDPQHGSPLAALQRFCHQYLSDTISSIHVLPFNPYTSDDGFSVSDYLQVHPTLGTWDDFQLLGQQFNLMFDLVLNHCSQQHQWFQSFLAGEEPYRHYFVEVRPDHPDLNQVFRPRALPLVHQYQAQSGTKNVWTTFSQDQVDLNFANPEVLIEFVRILRHYLEHGFRLIRLDAVGFVWKELGTSCIHHPKTHAVVQILRLLACGIRADAVLITETNVPHQDNISYFGHGDNEAHMVYQFALPPLTLDAFLRGDARHLSRWASELKQPGPAASFFNFLASHDGIGVLAARDYLSADEIAQMLQQVEKRGGHVSYKATAAGQIPYELNISYADAIAETELPAPLRSRKFLSSQAIMIAMAGVPGIYIHSLLGTPNWSEGVQESGIKRRINRRKLDLNLLERQLQDHTSFAYHVLSGFRQLLQVRRSYAFFAPTAPQTILQLERRLFAFVRGPESGQHALCLTNVSDQHVPVLLPAGHDLLSPLNSTRQCEFKLQPYQTVWWLQD